MTKTPAQVRADLEGHFERDRLRRWWSSEELADRLEVDGDNPTHRVGKICGAMRADGHLERHLNRIGPGDPVVSWRRVE